MEQETQLEPCTLLSQQPTVQQAIATTTSGDIIEAIYNIDLTQTENILRKENGLWITDAIISRINRLAQLNAQLD